MFVVLFMRYLLKPIPVLSAFVLLIWPPYRIGVLIIVDLSLNVSRSEAIIKTRGCTTIENLENFNAILYILVFSSEKL